MADSKVADLTEDTAPASNDWVYKVANAGTSGTDRKVSVANLHKVSKLVVRKTADESVTSSTTPQNDDELFFAIAANEIWAVDFSIFYWAANTTPDINVRVTAPAGASGGYGSMGLARSITSNVGSLETFYNAISGGTNGAGAYTTGGDLVLKTWALVVNSSTAGNVNFQFCQDTSSATAITVKAGSFLVAHRLL